jgi:tripartite-type tricarboxylate transporter receptor subunit TctC
MMACEVQEADPGTSFADGGKYLADRTTGDTIMRLPRSPFSIGIAVGAATIVLVASVGVAFAQQSAEEFFRSRKDMNFITSSAPGGGYDSYSRLFAKYMSKYLPGNPVILVNNMPGGGGIRAANFLYNVAPKDGSTIALLDRGVASAPLLYGEESKAQFDAVKFNWLGSAMSENGMAVVSTAKSVLSIEDAKTHEVIVGATAPEQDPAMFPRLLNDLLGTKFKIVYGYKGQPDTFLAIERGELDGLFMSGWSGPGRAYVREKIKEGKMALLVQMSATGDPAHSDTPTILSLIKDDQDRQVVELLLSRLSLGRPFLSPPGIPADRVALLRDAFRKAITDPELLEEAAKARLAINPIFGEEAQAVITKIYQASPELVLRARHIIKLSDAN